MNLGDGEARNEILEKDAALSRAIFAASIMASQGGRTPTCRAGQQAIAMNPQRIESYISLQRLYTTREIPPRPNYTSARAGCESDLDTRRTEYGRFLTYATRDNEAEVQFKIAVEIDPASSRARGDRGILLTSKQYEKAKPRTKTSSKFRRTVPKQACACRVLLGRRAQGRSRRRSTPDHHRLAVIRSPHASPSRQLLLERKDLARVYEQLDALLDQRRRHRGSDASCKSQNAGEQAR